MTTMAKEDVRMRKKAKKGKKGKKARSGEA